MRTKQNSSRYCAACEKNETVLDTKYAACEPTNQISQQQSICSCNNLSSTPPIDQLREHQPSLKPSGKGGVLGRGVLNGIRPSASGTSNSVLSTPSIRDSSRTNHLAKRHSSSSMSDARVGDIGRRSVCQRAPVKDSAVKVTFTLRPTPLFRTREVPQYYIAFSPPLAYSNQAFTRKLSAPCRDREVDFPSWDGYIPPREAASLHPKTAGVRCKASCQRNSTSVNETS